MVSEESSCKVMLSQTFRICVRNEATHGPGGNFVSIKKVLKFCNPSKQEEGHTV